MSKNSEIEEEIGEASSEADDEAEDAHFKCLPEIGRPARVLAQAYKVSHLYIERKPHLWIRRIWLHPSLLLPVRIERGFFHSFYVSDCHKTKHLHLL